MNALSLLTQAGISFNRSEGFWVRLDCQKCQGRQSRTMSFNYVTGFVECHRCGWKGKSGDLFRILGVKGDATELQYVEEKSKSLVQDFPEDCVEAWQDARARQYLAGRGITQKQAEYFGFFFCRGGRYCNRIILPIFDHHQRYCAFQARTIVDDEPKYQNPSGAQLSHLLYGLSWNFHKRNKLILVEGIFDCLHLFPYGVASFSKNISDTQIQLLRLSGCQEIAIVFDTDSWKDTPEKHQQNIERLSRRFLVRDVHLPAQSPTEYSMEEIRSMIRDTKVY